MICPKCGKECSDEVNFCDNCGTALTSSSAVIPGNDVPVSYNPQNYSQPGTNPYQYNQYNNTVPINGPVPGKGKATASLVLGILSFFFVPVILGIIGLVLSCQSKKEGYQSGVRTAGFVTSLIGLILGSFIHLVYILFFAGTLAAMLQNL